MGSQGGSQEQYDPQKHMDSILHKIQKLGITPRELEGLKSYKKLENSSREFSRERWRAVWSVVAGVVSVTLGFIWYMELYTIHGFSRAWLEWENLDLYAEQCTIETPDKFQDLFRPPVDCDMCRSVHEVDRVGNITPTDFEMKYAYSGRPVVVTDGTKDWGAPHVFSFDFFKNVYQDDSPTLTNYGRGCQFFPYQTEFKSLGEVFNMSKDRAEMKDGSQPWYIGWSNCDSNAAINIRQYYRRPYFLPSSAEGSRTDWIFMGSPGYGAHMHIDNVGNPSWQAQITGAKKWVLQPPPECYRECKVMEVIVHPGEIIVLDTNQWYHATHVVSSDMSITIGSEYD